MNKISYILILLKNHQILSNSHLKMHFCAVEVSWIYWHRNWDSKSWVYAPKISPSWWLEFKSGVKVEFKWRFKVEFWNPSFIPDLVKTGIKKFEFKSSICTQISLSKWLEFKSGVKVKFKWSCEVEFWNPSFYPDLVKTGI